MNRRRFLSALLLLISVFVVGCEDNSSVPNPLETQRIGPAGGTFTFQDGAVRLVVPSGSLSSETDVTVRAAGGYPVDARLVAGTAWTVTTQNGASFSGANRATLRLRYSQLPLGADPAGLRVFRLTGGAWTEATSNVDVDSQIVRTDITQAGTFAIFSTQVIGAPEVFRTVLSTHQETSSVVGEAFGTARLEVASNHSQIQVRLQTSGLTSVTMAHIHVGRLGEAGPVAADLFVAGDPAFSNDYTTIVTQARLKTAVVANMEALVAAIEEGRAYVNIHTTANPSGMIRGQLGTGVRVLAALSGGVEVPPSGSAATGNAVLTFDRDMTHMTVELNETGIVAEEITAAHIHAGVLGQNGPVIFPLLAGGNHTTSFVINLEAANFTPQGDIDTFDKAIGEILSGRTYVNIHSTAHAGGEIRGQLIPPLLE